MDNCMETSRREIRYDERDQEPRSTVVDSAPNRTSTNDNNAQNEEEEGSYSSFLTFNPGDMFDWDAQKFSLKRTWQRRAGVAFSVMGFISSSSKALVSDITQLRRVWFPAYEAFVSFLQTTGLDKELHSLINRRLLDNIVILGLIQKEVLGRDPESLADRRDDAFMDIKRLTNLPTKNEALRYMKFATAVYGESMIQAAQIGRTENLASSFLILPALPGDKTRIRSRIRTHCDIPSDEDLVVADIDFGGSASGLRHFIALDHNKKEVILSIRGTFSWHEVIGGVAAFSRPFCGGEAHSEMAGMAERLWQTSGPTILNLLEKHQDYVLVLVGHSLGAGTAALLNILCHDNNREIVRGRKVRCFTFACPPVFTPLGKVPEAICSCTNYIHENDFVPFLSVDSVRHLFNCIRAIEERELRLVDRVQLMTKYKKPDEELIALVHKAHLKRLEPLPGAPVLTIPASNNFWMKEHLKSTSVAYDIKVCDSIKLAKLGILIDANMLDDHLPSLYEYALQHLD